MSAVQKSIPKLRIIALPLTRPTLAHAPRQSSNSSSNSSILTYYHFQMRLPPEAGGRTKDGSRLGGYVKWVQTKAADAWATFGKADEGSWKFKTYRYGERLVDRIDFEELALKGVDPSLGPSVTTPDITGSKEKGGNKGKLTIPLIYPPSLCSSPSAPTPHIYSPLEHLRDLVAHRKPRHRKGFYTWMIIAPFTAPFMIIPIIPNLPFFFCVWRSWSHWRAYRGSQYLESLMDSGAIVPQASQELDRIYDKYRPSPSSSQRAPTSSSPKSPSNSSQSPVNPSSTSSSSSTSDSTTTSHFPKLDRNLLTRNAVPAILSLFSLPSSAGADMYRAIEQTRWRSARMK